MRICEGLTKLLINHSMIFLKVGRSRLGIDSILERLERMVKKESVVNKNWTAMMIIGKYW